MAELAIAISADVDLAKSRVAAYRRLRRERGHLELTQATELRAYEAVIAEYKVIDIHQAIAAGGWDADGRPRLAIGRADYRDVMLEWATRGFPQIPATISFACLSNGRTSSGNGERMHPTRVRVDATLMPSRDWTGFDSWEASCFASRVPTIPPEIREGNKLALANYHVLFEAQWYKVKPSPRPADPYLLRYLGGSLFAVMAEWDVSEIEALALGAVI